MRLPKRSERNLSTSSSFAQELGPVAEDVLRVFLRELGALGRMPRSGQDGPSVGTERREHGVVTVHGEPHDLGERIAAFCLRAIGKNR